MRRGGRPLGEVSRSVLAQLEAPRTVRELAALTGGTLPLVAKAVSRLQQQGRVEVAGCVPASNRGPVRTYVRADEAPAEPVCSVTVLWF